MNKLLILIIVCFSFVIATTKPNLDIQAESFEVNLSTNYFEVKNDIVITQGDLVINADMATYNESKQKIYLFGNIETKYESVSVYCQTMIYDRDKGIITATDKVSSAYQDYDIHGDKLIYYLNDGKMQFYGATTINQSNNVLESKDVYIDLIQNKIYSDNQTRFRISNE